MQIKIHKIYTKNENDIWYVLNMKNRLTNDVDPRDSQFQREVDNQTLFNILIPYYKITALYSGYVGYDRQYINDNSIDIFYVFNIDDSKDAEEFAREYINATTNETYPEVKAFRNYIKGLNLPIYNLKYTVEKEDGTIIEL